MKKYYYIVISFIIFSFACKTIMPNTPPVESKETDNTSQNTQESTFSSIDIEWSTFLGINGVDPYINMTIDNNGNLYILTSKYLPSQSGQSGEDTGHMSLGKLKGNGEFEWSTLITDTLKADGGAGLATDNKGYIYITSTSNATWGNPINPFVNHNTTPNHDSFLVKVDSNGEIIWNTFLEKKYISGLTVDANDNIYFLNTNTFLAKVGDISLLMLNPDGNIQKTYDLANLYNTTQSDIAPTKLTLDNSGNIYVYGYETNVTESPHDWGIFIAKLSNTGELLWKSLIKNYSVGSAEMFKAVVDNNGNTYLVGESYESWGTPISPYDGGRDYEDPTVEFLNGVENFVVKLDSDGNILWNTFLNKSAIVIDCAITPDGYLYLAGHSDSSWGAPIVQFSGQYDGFIAKFDPDGLMVSNTFVGGEGSDFIQKITIDQDNLFLTGLSSATFGNPVNPISINPEDMFDVFVVNLGFEIISK